MTIYSNRTAALSVIAVLLSACGGGGGGQSSPSSTSSAESSPPITSNPSSGPADPIASDDTVTVLQDSSNNIINVLGNDQPSDANLQGFSSNSANGGTITLNNNGTPNDQSDDTLRYTPPSGISGSDSFNYIISNSAGGTDSATVQISITPTPNSSPVANDDDFSVAGGSSNTSLFVLANDTDPDNDSVFLSTFPSSTNESGTLSRNDNGTPNDGSDDTLIYTPAEGFSGDDTFEYSVNDGNGGFDSAEVTIAVGAGEPAGADRGTGCRDKDVRFNSGIGYCFDAEFNTAHDGTKIDMTVYVPHPNRLAELTTGSLAEGELGFVPLVIHSHGFGGSKAEDFEVDPAHFVDLQTGRDAWQRGYFVISFSERGFGQSGGQIGFMDPTKEGQDQNELLDWAIKHLRGPSTIGGNDGIYDFTFDANNAEHTSSVPLTAADTRPSLLMNDLQTRLQPSASDDTSDPSVGTLGYSYGGGYQYTFSHADTENLTDRTEMQRLDALIPEGTWHDLRYSLHSNDSPKGYWATLLFSFAVQGGTLSNGQPVPTLLAEFYAEAVVAGRVSAANQNILGAHSTSFYCDENLGVTTDVALLHIQGVRDTLFDFNDGYNNAKCFADAGNDVRYLAVSGGHPLTISQQPIYTGQTTSMDIDEVIHCGTNPDTQKPQRLIVKDMMYAWFEEKLRGQTGQADVIPNVCINQENTVAEDLLVDDNYHGNNTSFNYLKEGVVLNSIDDIKVGALSPNEANANASPSYQCDIVADGEKCSFQEVVPLSSVPVAEQQTPVQKFVALYTEPSNSTGRVMAGIPTAQMQLEISVVDPISGLAAPFSQPTVPTTPPFHVFVGVALKRGDANPVILHDQLTPIRQTYTFPWTDTAGVQTENGNSLNYGCGTDAEALCDRGRLVGVTTRILPNDQIGLIFTPSDAQYANMVNVPATGLRITGNVEFPMYPASAAPASNNPQP